jgi:hypothetical protein
MPQIEQNPQIDERVWQAWMKKNEAKDRARYARRLKVIKVVLVFLALGALLWRLQNI